MTQLTTHLSISTRVPLGSSIPRSSTWPWSLIILLLINHLGCDAGIPSDEANTNTRMDVGPIFFEPTLDMTVEQDRGEGEVSRVLGQFGDPCESNLDCADNWCVSSGEESVCTYTCLGGECPNGWSCRAVSNNSQDVTQICVPQEDRLCKPCESHDDCPTGYCYTLDGEQVCGSQCERTEECAEGYSCLGLGPEGESLCAPSSRSCSCDVSQEGDVRICENLSEAGLCYGRQTCGGSEGWSTCDAQDPVLEICNQIDDDCNGITDDLPDIGTACRQEAMIEGELRVCEGITLCVMGEEQPQCSANIPQIEACNFRDDDCDGEVDEGFEGRDESCSIGVGACQRYGVQVCNDSPRPEDASEEWSPIICNAVAGEPDLEEVCDGLDNDCDGQTDEDYPTLGEICTVGEGFCRQSSVTRCDPSGLGVICEVNAGQGELELCDGADNDCDGRTDEDYIDLNTFCNEGIGLCQRRGLHVCSDDGLSLICSVTAAEPTAELCDNRDNDCDGQSDEDFPLRGEPCTDGQGACEAVGVTRCNDEGTTVICSAQPSMPSAESCDRIDNDCDGLVDESYPIQGEPCVVGQGVCQAVGVTQCNEEGTTVTCSAVASPPTDERCDNLDNDCDGSIDETFNTLGDVCQIGEGLCRQTGVIRCLPDQNIAECSVVAATPTNEFCDGADNDCDGQIDEGYPDLNTLCEVGEGLCQRRGLWICDPQGVGLTCSVSSGQGEDEICDDLDNDCDGNTDEGFNPRGEPCIVGMGACQAVGITRCNEEGSEVICSATPNPVNVESCDNLDNDCDGSVDEDYPTLNELCSAGAGVCQTNGVNRCAEDGQDVVCSVTTNPPTVERCDNLDNDCDGRFDEDFIGLNDFCSAGEGICQRRGLLVCAADELNVTCNVTAGAPAEELCDDLDNDCDGQIDEGYAERGVPCLQGIGACEAVGVTRCDLDGRGVSCSVSANQPSNERCDNLDNDCDGQIDETFIELNELCSEGIGVCQRRGLKVCAIDELSVACSANVAPPEAEVCDDLDNDCDGSIDEDYTAKGNPCSVGLGLCQVVGVNRCNDQNDGVICSATPGQAEQESCDGLDNDCDGTTDESHPLVNTQCTSGQGLCLRSGVYECDRNDINGNVVCAAEVVAGALNDICDYQDDDCDGQVDEDFIINGQYLSLSNCGACGSDCTTIWEGGAELYHINPTCEVINELTQCSYECLAGYFDLDGLSNNGCEFSPDQAAIYIKPSQYGGQDTIDCGNFDLPCATLNYGVQVAQSLSKSRLRVAEGVYREMFELPNGFEVLGGHQQNSWIRSPEVTTSHIDARGLVSMEVHRYGVIARNINQPTVLDGFLITADTPIVEGNSYGLYLVDSDENLVISHNRIVAGDGGRGRDGILGSNGSDGLQGSTGSDSFGVSNPSCNGNILNLGGVGGVKFCDGAVVSGGRGAGSICPDFDEPAGIATNGFGSNPGSLGITAYAFYSEDQFSCSVGDGPRDAGTGGVGQNGRDGTGGSAAFSAQGSMLNLHWVGVSGQSGSLAGPGSGGGGGGGAAGVEIRYRVLPAYDIGATGGGGGSGGCGGGGGIGGKSGGGSFGILITYTSPVNDQDQMPVVQDNVINRGFGGSGGTGGPGGTGGRGGLPGLGGGTGASVYQDFCSLQGGDGGKGGDGGTGGGGAGGQGGASYDFYIHNTSNQSPDYDVLNISLVGNEVSTGGAGGVGGISANVNIGIGADGLDGVSGILYVD